LPQPPNPGCANFLATVFKDLSSILVDGGKKSTPRQACLAAPIHSEPRVKLSLPCLFDAPGDTRGSSIHLKRRLTKIEISALGRNVIRTIYNWFDIAPQPIRCWL
jgi:hypothetical protein